VTASPRVDLVTVATTGRVLRDAALLLLLCTVLVAGAALGFSLARGKRYASTATLLVRTPVIAAVDGRRSVPSLDPGRQSETDLRLMSLPVLADRAAQRLGGFTASAVSRDIRVTTEGTSYLYSISATASRPALAARLANVYAQEFVAFRDGLDRSRLDAVLRLVHARLHSPALLRTVEGLAPLASGEAVIVRPAEPPGAPSSPRTVRNTVVGGVIGLLLGFSLVVAHGIWRRQPT
jgi:uncharacterized protein involved in exopolysaccharide biosynthesis